MGLVGSWGAVQQKPDAAGHNLSESINKRTAFQEGLQQGGQDFYVECDGKKSAREAAGEDTEAPADSEPREPRAGLGREHPAACQGGRKWGNVKARCRPPASEHPQTPKQNHPLGIQQVAATRAQSHDPSRKRKTCKVNHSSFPKTPISTDAADLRRELFEVGQRACVLPTWATRAPTSPDGVGTSAEDADRLDKMPPGPSFGGCFHPAHLSEKHAAGGDPGWPQEASLEP